MRLLSGFARRRPGLASLGALAVLGVAGTWFASRQIERRGWDFIATGRDAVETLTALAGAAQTGDAAAFESHFDPGYQGRLLGLAAPDPADERDGVRRGRFRGAGAADRGAALAEWRDYFAEFERLERVELHLHRLESWDPEAVVASVRFEVEGVPRGETRAAVDRGLLRFAFTPERRIRGGELIEGERVFSSEPLFTEVAGDAGIGFENRVYPRFVDQPLKFAMLRYGPAGISAADVDNDGFYDLFVPDGVESRLFRNLGDGRFEDVTAASGLSGLSGVGVGIFADFDDDGWKDLYVSRTFEPNQLFRSNGAGADGRVTFTDVTAASGLGADCCTTAASVADVDGDGRLDLYVGRYLDPRERIPTTFYARNGEPNRLYRNLGGGRFADVTEALGVGEVGLCLGTVFGDVDDDGDPDLYVVNDFGRNTLYRNDGGRFTDVTVDAGTLDYGAGMNASLGDYDNDGDLDLYVTNIRSEFAWFGEWPMVSLYMLETFRQGVWRSDYPLFLEMMWQSGPELAGIFQKMGAGNTLMRNRGDGTFEDVTWDAGANPPGWFWGAAFADFDNDGWQDLYAADGWVYNDRGTEIELDFFIGVVSDQKLYKTGRFFDPDYFGTTSWHGWERNRHLRNNRDGTFTEIGLAAGTDLLLNSRGVAVADFRNRGLLDIAVASSGDRHALLRNDLAAPRHWLEVDLVGAGAETADGSPRDAVGARVHLLAGGLRQTREVVLGDGYGSQNPLRLHFGLGEAGTVDELVVRWPRSRREQRFTDLAADRIVTLHEGRDAPR